MSQSTPANRPDSVPEQAEVEWKRRKGHGVVVIAEVDACAAAADARIDEIESRDWTLVLPLDCVTLKTGPVAVFPNTDTVTGPVVTPNGTIVVIAFGVR